MYVVEHRKRPEHSVVLRREAAMPRTMSPVELGFIGCDPMAAVLARGLGEHVLCADT